MALVFDTYTKHSRIYKLIQASIILFGVSLMMMFVLQFGSIKTTSPLGRFCVYTLLFSVLGFVIGYCILIIPSKRFLMYVKDGELELTTNTVSFDSNIYNLDSLNKIEIKVDGFRGQGKGRGGGVDGISNKIKIYKTPNEVITKLFVLNSRDELDNLKAELMQWKQNGFKIKVYGFDLR